MSRIPQPPSRQKSQSQLRTRTASPLGRARVNSPAKKAPDTPQARSPQPRLRTKSTPQAPTRSAAARPPVPDEGSSLRKEPASIKEAIALKRAEAKKSRIPAGGGLADLADLADALPTSSQQAADVAENDELGRKSVKETIERARTTGSLNLCARDLPCIPSALFEIHLGITPDPLKSVPEEPPLSADLSDSHSRTGRDDRPAWFQAQDLTILKAWNNEISEIQPEISLFGSLKSVDLHSNKLIALPDSFGDLTSLTHLVLSKNSLASLPTSTYSLPNLTYLDVSHNALTSLPFISAFTADGKARSSSSLGGDNFFAPVVERASRPLPRLLTLDASHNKLSADSIDHSSSIALPAALSKLNLSKNPLGNCASLLLALSRLHNLKELRMSEAVIGPDAFPADLLAPSAAMAFPSLQLLDLEQTAVGKSSVSSALQCLRQELSFDVMGGDPPPGTLTIIVGKKVLREAWELEAERKTKARAARPAETHHYLWDEERPKPPPETKTPSMQKPPMEVPKESWELEAEQGLLTEGGRRRARAAAAAAAVESSSHSKDGSSGSASPKSSGSSLAESQYFSRRDQSLTLPASAPQPKGHGRAFSLASSPGAGRGGADKAALALPTPTLPLAVIASQPFAQTLRSLTLANRRADISFSLPSPGAEALLPCLEELSLEGCGLGDAVAVTGPHGIESGAITPTRMNEALLPLIARLFPSIRSLDLSQNVITSGSLAPGALSSLILESAEQEPKRKGLKVLRLRGNRIAELDGFLALSELFKGHRVVSQWHLEELDLRDNDIPKLPPELGYLPLDVFLVDGNAFRVPQHRVWEREGTKGLLSWLRGRIE